MEFLLLVTMTKIALGVVLDYGIDITWQIHENIIFWKYAVP